MGLVELDKQANVRLMDEFNYGQSDSGRQFRFQGGLDVRSPIALSPPYQGSLVRNRGSRRSTRVRARERAGADTGLGGRFGELAGRPARLN